MLDLLASVLAWAYECDEVDSVNFLSLIYYVNWHLELFEGGISCTYFEILGGHHFES